MSESQKTHQLQLQRITSPEVLCRTADFFFSGVSSLLTAVRTVQPVAKSTVASAFQQWGLSCVLWKLCKPATVAMFNSMCQSISQKVDSSITALISVVLQLELGASEEGSWIEKSLHSYSLHSKFPTLHVTDWAFGNIWVWSLPMSHWVPLSSLENGFLSYLWGCSFCQWMQLPYLLAWMSSGISWCAWLCKSSSYLSENSQLVVKDFRKFGS